MNSTKPEASKALNEVISSYISASGLIDTESLIKAPLELILGQLYPRVQRGRSQGYKVAIYKMEAKVQQVRTLPLTLHIRCMTFGVTCNPQKIIAIGLQTYRSSLESAYCNHDEWGIIKGRSKT